MRVKGGVDLIGCVTGKIKQEADQGKRKVVDWFLEWHGGKI